MNLRRLGVSAAVLGLAAATIAPVASASASTPAPLGTRSLAAVLTSDGNQFDRNWYDYDVVTEAVLAVLDAKPTSPVKVLTDGTVPLTAFIPNDRAFQVLVRDLTGKTPRTERATFQAVAGLGIDTVEAVLLYHVVPGATITKKDAVKDIAFIDSILADDFTGTNENGDTGDRATELQLVADFNQQVESAIQDEFTVKVYNRYLPIIELRDQDPNDVNPFLNPRALDINKGNRQIAHGIVFVLRPADL